MLLFPSRSQLNDRYFYCSFTIISFLRNYLCKLCQRTQQALVRGLTVRQIQVCLIDYNIIPHPCEVGVGRFYASKSPMYLYAVVLLMSQTLANSLTFNCLLLYAGQWRRKLAGMSSLLTCGRPIWRPLALAFSMPDRTLARIIASSNWLNTPAIWRNASLMGSA